MKLKNKKIFIIIIITIIITMLVCHKLWANNDLIQNTNLSVSSNQSSSAYVVEKDKNTINSEEIKQENANSQNVNLIDENLENKNLKSKSLESRNSENIENSSLIDKNSNTTGSVSTNKNTINSQNAKININTATQTELETLPGIGPSIALKIVNYRRQYGKFKTIEDIKNVSGIGDKKYAKIEKYIKI